MPAANKLVFINENYINIFDLLLIPLGYSPILLTLGQLVSNCAYWFSLHMKLGSCIRAKEPNDQEIIVLMILEIQRVF